MVNAFFCEQDYPFQTETIFEQNKAFIPLYFSKYTFLRINTLWNMYLSLKKQIRKFRRMDPQKEVWTIQKVDTSKRLYLEEWPLERYFSWSTSLSKLLQHDSRIRFKKSNVMWQDPKKAVTSLKSWWTIKQLFFHFCDISKCWERKATSSLSNLRPVDQRSSRLKICTLQR